MSSPLVSALLIEAPVNRHFAQLHPDPQALTDAVALYLQTGLGRGTTRVYSETVNLLWQEGKQEAAIRLEEYWNELARQYPFSLFCGYMLDVHHDRTYAGPLEEIGRTHSDMIGTADDERFRVALDAASRDVFGVPLSQMVGFSSNNHEGERRFPSGQRTMLWVKRNLPSASTDVLERAHRYYEDSLDS